MTSSTLNTNDTIIFAHRGASGYSHENSFEAFDKALDLGSEGLEFDCWLTKDEKVVIYHDRFFKNSDPTHSHIIPRMTLKEIKLLELPNGQEIPTLEEFLQRYSQKRLRHPLNGFKKILFSIDLQDNLVGHHILPILQKFNVQTRTFLCSSTLWKFRQIISQNSSHLPHMIASNLEYQIKPEHLDKNGKIAKLKIDGFNIQASRFEEIYGYYLNRANFRLFIWDLHTPTLLKKYLTYRPYAIYTNFPDKAIRMRKKSRNEQNKD